MGMLVDGEWVQDSFDTRTRKGAFVRADSRFRNWITADGSPGPTGDGGFRAEPGRYHLYIGHACPWAHRTHVFLKLKGLESMISKSVVHWFMGEQGWTFEPGDGVIPDSVNNAQALHEIYRKASPEFTGRVTIPVLWDKERETIVNNESSEIIRMFNSAFDCIGAAPGDYYPQALRQEIDAVNRRVYDTLNNGVYKSGFAMTQEAYEAGRPSPVRNPRLARRAPRRLALPGRRYADRGGLAALPHPGPVRCRLPRPFQMQSPPPRRLSQPLGPYEAPVRHARYRGNRVPRPHQAALLWQPRHHQSHPGRARGAGDFIRIAAPLPDRRSSCGHRHRNREGGV